MGTPAGAQMLSKAVRFAALGLVFLALLTLAIVSIAEVYEAIFDVLLSPEHVASAVLTGSLLSAAIPAGYLVANTFAFCRIAVGAGAPSVKNGMSEVAPNRPMEARSLPRTGIWMAAAFAAALAAALGVVMIKGAGESGLAVNLRVTARIAYLFFWPAYVGAAAATLFGARFNIVARHTRALGLAFASALLVHVGLVIWLALISPPQPLADAVMPFFAIGIVWAYLLAFVSIGRVRATFDAYSVRVVRAIGTEYIALVFFTDFVILPKHPLQYPLLYIPFWAMLGLGPLLRLGATVRRLHRLGPVSAA